MKTFNNIAALSLSLVLGLAPFALIAANDLVVARTAIAAPAAANPEHALGMEGR
jgi:hypothetical protein